MNKEQLLQEIQFKAVRSSGPGGQHVNKVATKVLLAFDISGSMGLSETEKQRLVTKLSNRLTKEGILMLHCDDYRSQVKNKKCTVNRFFKLLEASLKVAKKRKKTKPSKAAVQKRLDLKKKTAQKKATRGKIDLE